MLFLAACGGNGEEGILSGAGRYIETDVTPPIEGRFTSYLTDDGVIVCFSDGLKSRFESADGGDSWTESPGPGRNNDLFQMVQGGALMKDGSLLVFLQGQGFVKVAPDGGSVPFPVSEIDKVIADGENVFVSLLQALDDKLLISYTVGGFAMQSVRQDGPGGGGQPIGQRANTSVGGDGAVTREAPEGMAPEGTRGEAPVRTSGEEPGDVFVGRSIETPGEESGGVFVGTPVRLPGEEPEESSG